MELKLVNVNKKIGNMKVVLVATYLKIITVYISWNYTYKKFIRDKKGAYRGGEAD